MSEVSTKPGLSLTVNTTCMGDIAVVHCRGRIVVREEAEALSNAVVAALDHSRHIILELQQVTSIDSGGMGELVALHMWAQARGATLKLSGLSSRLSYLLELTNLSTLFQIFPDQDTALKSCHVA